MDSLRILHILARHPLREAGNSPAVSMDQRLIMSESLLTAKDLAEVLCVSVRQVRRLQAAEDLPAPVYIGRLPRWRESEIAGWMQAGCPDRQKWEARKAVKA